MTLLFYFLSGFLLLMYTCSPHAYAYDISIRREYWLNSIHFPWLYFADCLRSPKLWFSPRLCSCRLLSFEDNKSDYHSESYFKCISFSPAEYIIVHIYPKLNYYSGGRNGESCAWDCICIWRINSMRVLFKHVRINQSSAFGDIHIANCGP